MTNEQATHAPLQLHIALNGCDGWSGFLPAPNEDGTDGPLATIEEALRRIRGMRRAGVFARPIDVLMHAGLYTRSESIVFGEEDLQLAGGAVTIRSAGDGEVRIAGGARLQGFRPIGGGVYKLDLREAGYPSLRFKQLSCNGVRMQAARYPNFDLDNPFGGGWLYVEGPVVSMYEAGHGEKDRFICRDPRLAAWTRIEEAEIFIFPRFNWNNNVIRVKSYDAATGEVVLEKPASYEIYPGDRFYFRHVREELDEPGEWYLDEREEAVYFYPPAPIEECVVTVPLTDHIVELRGKASPADSLDVEKIDWRDSGGSLQAKPEAAESGYIIFQQVTFEDCNSAGVLMRDVRGCELRGCVVRNTGGAGVIVLGGGECRVAGCDIGYTGSHGLYLSGGFRSPFRGMYVPGGHAAENNYVHHMGSENKASAGIALYGVGMRAANNLIHDGPRWGILSRGNDHVIEYNHIRHVNIETSDTAAIYLVDRDLSFRGTKIRFNRIHDVLGYHYLDGAWHSPAFAFGIYLDDWTSGVEIYGNLVYRTPSGGVYVHAGRDNRIENNLIADIRDEMVYLRRWDRAKEQHMLGTPHIGLRNNMFRRNVFAGGETTSTVYKFTLCLNEQGELDVDGNVWEHNLVWLPGRPAVVTGGTHHKDDGQGMDWAAWQALGFDRSSLAANPQLDQETYELAPASPAWSLGFERLPVEKMGLYADETRASWPVREAEGARERPLVRT